MQTELDLPRLSSADLVAQFGNDEAALRRYRMLVALVREGRPPGEVARAFGVSRESVRRLRQAFIHGGLAALRSRKRGGGHLAHATPLALTLRQELQADPGVSSAVLWRRVQARMREAGMPVPRSTFYRLLAQLRDEEPGLTNERTAVSLLRDALNALAEDPPLALGRSGLAVLLLPDLREPLQRGRWLQRAMRAAIERLRPAEAGQVLDDPRWRHYLIIAGEYETGEKRATLQEALALSASTYSRAKREALDRLFALLPVVLGELPPPEPPATLIAPPAPPAVFDRELELEEYMARLRRAGLALIWGPAGTGKMDLAAALAARLRARGQKVVWHTCRAPEIDPHPEMSLLLTLAAARALDGWPKLWEALRLPEPHHLNQYLRILADALAGRHWTVIIANAHWLRNDEAARVLDVLTAAQEQRDLRLVLVSRQLPNWADPEQWPSLPFPSDAPARQIFLRKLAEQPEAPHVRSLPTAGSLRDRVIELVATIPVESLDSLSTEQIADILASLRPIEQITDELRTVLRTRSTPSA